MKKEQAIIKRENVALIANNITAILGNAISQISI